MIGLEKDFREREYFFNHDKSKDTNVAIAGNCFEQLVAIILKNTWESKVDYYALALEDVSFHIICDKDGYLIRSAIKCNDTGINKGLWNISKSIIQRDRKQAQEELENVLNERGYAIVRTVDELLAFSRYFGNYGMTKETFDYDRFAEKGHVFLIVGQDKDNYYYVDQPNELDMKYYESVSGRRDIGVYPKEKFLDVFELYLGIYVADFNWEKIENISKVCDSVLIRSVWNFNNNYISRDIKKVNLAGSGGKAALHQLDSMLDEEKLELGRRVYQPSTGEYSKILAGNELLNGITSIENRRKALKGYLYNHSRGADAVAAALDLWKQWKNIILRRYAEGGGVLAKRDFDYARIIEAEENMFSFLEKDFNK